MRLRWVIVVALLLLLALAGYWLLPPLVVVETVRPQALEQRLVATGRVIGPERIEVGSVLVGTVAQVLVEEGALVAPGQPLVRLVSEEAEAAVRNAEAALQQALTNLRQIEQVRRPVAAEERVQAELQLRQAQRDYRRNQALARERFVSQAELETRKEAVDLAASRLRSAEQALAALQPAGSEYQAAVAGREQAQAALAEARARLDHTLIRAPLAATVIRREVDPGDVVQPGARALVLVSRGETLVEAQFDERNLGLLRLGQPALASADAYPRERFAARVSFIAPAVDVQRATITVKLTVPTPPAYLRADMTVSVDVLVDRREQALTVPRSAVRAVDTRPWLLLVRDGRVARQEVVLGLLGDERVEIRRGVAAGEQVILEPDDVTVGERVRTREVRR
jgi:HlyD family secretion protein